jgi:xanthine/uracil/vitamin C permease (AzgA family)
MAAIVVTTYNISTDIAITFSIYLFHKIFQVSDYAKELEEMKDVGHQEFVASLRRFV